MAEPVIRKAPKKEILRFARFAIVGVSGTLIDFGVLTLLKEVCQFGTLLANTISYSCGVVNNFTWNRLWTFHEARSRSVWKQFIQFVIVNVIALGLNNLIVLLLEDPLGTLLGDPERGYLPAKIIATGLVLIWNFVANRLWTFRDVEKQE